jgi:LmbE family N-acetylglucosaminyl deacetylase
MMRLGLFPPGARVSEVLFLGAHSDDIEIGCGATVLRLIEENPSLRVNWVVFSATGEREKEARRSAETLLASAPAARIEVHGYRNGYFPWVGAEIKDCFERMKGALSPDVIFTHRRDDAHQDHRVLCDLTWNTWRDHFILEYEIPKYDGDLGQPNLYVPISAEMTTRKIDHLMKAFATQRPRQWFTEETFRGLMRLRGVESCAPEQFAEAFYCRKIVL